MSWAKPLTTACVVLLNVRGANGACLADAIPSASRIWAKDDSGDDLPIGLFEGQWDSAYLFTTFVQILIEEVLGYHTILSEEDGISGASAHFALAGCLNWNSAQSNEDRKCDLNETRMHVVVDGWMSNWPSEAAYIAKYPHLVPEDLGSMGYDGVEGIYVTHDIMSEAYESEGLALNFYLSYNQTHHDAKQYFDGIANVNSSRLQWCNNTNLFNRDHMENYLRWTGDSEGLVQMEDGRHVAKCLNGLFWLSPACRADASSCIPVLTAGSGWGHRDIMQWATAYAMPLSLGVAKTFSDEVSMVKDGRFVFYWYEPDAAFALLSPSSVIFPRHSAQQWAQGDRRTAPKAAYVNKACSRNLQYKAPKVKDFLSKISFDLQEAQRLLSLTQGGMSFYNVSCQWIRENRNRWADWVSGATSCSAGYGLAAMTGAFLSSRDGAFICKECPAGRFSERFTDGVGSAYRCTICQEGTSQSKAGATQCDACAKGTYTNVRGQTGCEVCRFGSYQSDEGQTGCLSCPEDRTTLFLAAQKLQDCVCRAESIEHDGICVECSQGLTCPRGSTVQLLLDGESELYEEVPMVEQGYHSTLEAPLDIYKCIGHCPGGRPGTCDAGRIGVTCGNCPKYEFIQDERCRPCRPVHSALWVLACPLIFILIICSYYMSNKEHGVRATAASCIFQLFGLILVFCEIIAVVQSVAVEWPKGLAVALSYFEVFGLSFESLGLGCLAGTSLRSYVAQSFFFPILVVGCFVVQGLTQIIPFPKRFLHLKWTKTATCNMLGHLLQEAYIMMSNIAFIPFSCFTHPNGSESLLTATNILCGSAEHRNMQVFGAILGLLCMVFLALCSYAALKAPAWSDSPVRMSCIRFLIDRFRPDVWWYGIILLVRGPLLSIPAIVAANLPGLQMTGLMGIMLISVLIQVRFLPWNALLANVADAASCSLLLILLSIGIARLPAPVGKWGNGVLDISGIVVALLILAVWVVVVLAVAILVFRKAILKREETRIINLGKLARSRDVLLILEDISSHVNGWSSAQMQRVDDAINQLCVYDYQVLCTSLMLLSVEVGIGGRSSLGSTSMRIRGVSTKAQKLRRTMSRLSQVERDSEAHDLAAEDDESTRTEILMPIAQVAEEQKEVAEEHVEEASQNMENGTLNEETETPSDTASETEGPAKKVVSEIL